MKNGVQCQAENSPVIAEFFFSEVLHLFISNEVFLSWQHSGVFSWESHNVLKSPSTLTHASDLLISLPLEQEMGSEPLVLLKVQPVCNEPLPYSC